MSNGAPSLEDLLDIYHDLWDLRTRARRSNHSFLLYLFEVALEEIDHELSGHRPAHQQRIPPPQESG